MYEKLQFDALDDEVISTFKEPSYLNLMRSAVVYSDAIIKGSETLDEDLESFIDSQEKPVLDYQSPEDFADSYEEFYLDKVLNVKEEA